MAKPEKEFDREYIYNLIMPTTSTPEPLSLEDPAPEETLEAPSYQDSLSILRSKLSGERNTVQLHARRQMDLVNLTENLVVEKLDSAFEKFNCCKCDKCRMDTAAIALNMLAPHYVVAERGDVPRLLQERDTKEVSSAIIKAILKVKRNPQH